MVWLTATNYRAANTIRNDRADVVLVQPPEHSDRTRFSGSELLGEEVQVRCPLMRDTRKISLGGSKRQADL